MGISLRILLPLLLFYFFKVSLAQTFQNVVTYTTKPVVELECHFTSSSLTVVWSEQQDSGTVVLFFYGPAEEIVRKETNDTKHNNFEFHIDQDTNSFNLLIKNVDKDDGGRYVCTPFLANTVNYAVSVEVLPASININCSELNVCSSSPERKVSPQIVCICMATGISSEMVEIEWKGASSLSTRNTNWDMDSTTGTFSISSETTLPSLNESSSVSCSLTGYTSQIPERLRSSTYTFTPPVCNLLTQECLPDGKSALLICNCSDGSPEIKAYTFYDSDKSAIGTQFSNEKSVQVDPNRIETFYCSGCNGVLHNPKFVEHEVKCQQGWNWWILIIVILILLVAAILFIFIRKKCKVRSPPSGEEGYVNIRKPKSKTEEKREPLLSLNIPPQENKKTKDDKDEEYDNVSMQELNKVEHHDKHEQVGSDGGHESDRNKLAVKNEEANRKEKPSTHERTQGDGEENAKVHENINRCPIEYTGTDTDTGGREFNLTDIQADSHHGTSSDSTDEDLFCRVQKESRSSGEKKTDGLNGEAMQYALAYGH